LAYTAELSGELSEQINEYLVNSRRFVPPYLQFYLSEHAYNMFTWAYCTYTYLYVLLGHLPCVDAHLHNQRSYILFSQTATVDCIRQL